MKFILKSNKDISVNTKAAKRKKLKIGMYTTAITCVAIVIVVLINLFVGSLPSDKVKFDTTSEKLYSISEQTEKLVKAVDEKVTIYVIASESTYDMSVNEFLQRYTALNDNISIELKDPVLYPNFSSEYTDEDVEENSLIVVSEKNSRYIPYSSIYVTDYSYDYTTGSYAATYSFDCESLVTSAIDYVTSDNLPVVYTLTGHGEGEFASYSSVIEGYIESENITRDTLSLIKSGKVPEDADAVVIIEPSSDISADELTMLKEYLDNGGNILLISGSISPEMQNIISLTEYYGMKPVEGIVVEGDNNHSYLYKTYLLPDYESHTITSPLKGYYVIVPIAQGIELMQQDDSERTLVVQGLLYTSDDAYSKVAGSKMTTYEKEAGDIDGPFYLAAIGEEETENGTGKMAYISSAYVMDDSVNQVTSEANVDFVMNTLEYVLEREETISIRAKTISDEYLTISDATAFRWQVLLIGVIPLALVITGGVICYRRKKL